MGWALAEAFGLLAATAAAGGRAFVRGCRQTKVKTGASAPGMQMKKGDIMLIEQPQLRPEVSIRWLTIACFEIRVGDFRIVIDPHRRARVRPRPGGHRGRRYRAAVATHWDHITDLAYVMEKFHCPVLCGELSAPALIEMLNANPHDVYPVTPNLELDFGGARVRALFARHTNQHCTCGPDRPGTAPVDQHHRGWRATRLGFRDYRSRRPAG